MAVLPWLRYQIFKRRKIVHKLWKWQKMLDSYDFTIVEYKRGAQQKVEK